MLKILVFKICPKLQTSSTKLQLQLQDSKFTLMPSGVYSYSNNLLELLQWETANLGYCVYRNIKTDDYRMNFGSANQTYTVFARTV